jgi:hypothetical protein
MQVRLILLLTDRIHGWRFYQIDAERCSNGRPDSGRPAFAKNTAGKPGGPVIRASG